MKPPPLAEEGSGAGLVAGFSFCREVTGGVGAAAGARLGSTVAAAGADGGAISSMFFFTDKSPIKLRSWLVSSGCEIRG